MDEDGILETASYMHFFPLVGALVGLLAGAFAWVLGLVLPSAVVGMLGVGLILLVNGLQHADGLLDFGDGLMCHGSRERKLRVMQDPATGAGGLALGIVVLVTTALSISDLNRSILVQSLIVCEAAAKFSMVFEAWAGKSARAGMNTVFVNAMHARYGNSKATASVVILLVVSVLLLRQVGLLVGLVSILVSIAILTIARRNFGGITGDVMGATNEITRLVSLLAVLGATQWV
jgi:adenosylcobinamide-GDP ribazoletransferase